MMNTLLVVCLVVVGLINLAPIIGVLSADKLENAYGVALDSNNLIVLMRHRALLFGILGSFILYSAFNPPLQTAAMLMAAVSMIGYAVLIRSTVQTNQKLQKVLMVDYFGLCVLALAVVIKVFFV